MIWVTSHVLWREVGGSLLPYEDVGWGAGGASGFPPTLRKSAKDGAPEVLGWWRVGHPPTAEGIQKDESGVIVVEIREPVITTESQEVVVAFVLVALQTAGHEASCLN